MPPALEFADACRLLQTALAGNMRRQILIDLSKSKQFSKALLRLRDSMRAGIFKAGSEQVQLDRIVKTFDRQNAEDGFHVLHDWDGKADRLNPDIIPVDVLHYIHREGNVEASETVVLGI